MKRLIILGLAIFLILGLTINGIAKVKLDFWTSPSIKVEGLEPGEYEQRLIDEFEALYPDVEIVLEVIPYASGQNKIEFNIASGTPPDILSCDIPDMLVHYNAGLLVDFDDVIDKAKFYDYAIKACSIDGKMYYYPMGLRPGAMTINLDLAKKAEAIDLLPLDRPDRAWTAEEFKTYLIKVSELPNVYGWCFNFGDTIAHHHQRMLLLHGFGAVPFVFIDGKWVCTINSPEAAEGIKFYLDIYNNYPDVMPRGMENAGIGDFDGLWCQSKMAACMGSINTVVNNRKGADPQGEVILVPYPAKAGLSPCVPSDWCGFEVFNTGSDIRASWAKQFVKYFVDNGPDLTGANFNTSPVQEGMPTPKAFDEYAGDPEFEFALKHLPKYAMDTGSACPVYSQYAEIFRATMQGVIIGELTVEEGLAIVEDEVNKALDEYYAE